MDNIVNSDIIKERVNLIIEYIEQILSDEILLNSSMLISNNDDFCILDIKVPQRDFYRVFNLINKEYDYLIYEILFDKLFEHFIKSPTIAIAPLCRTRVSMISQRTGNGIRLNNLNGSILYFDFQYMTKKGNDVFQEKGNQYNKKIEDATGIELSEEIIISSYFGLTINNTPDKSNFIKR